MNTRTIGSTTSVRLEDIEKAVEALRSIEHKLLDSLQAELSNWMRGQGFDPDKNCYLILPMARHSELPSWPSFVRFSPLVDDAFLLRDNLGLL